jgi:hypothetical protein
MRVDRLIVEADERGELPKMVLKPHQLVEIIVLPDEVDQLRLAAEQNLSFWDNDYDECWDHV